MLIKFETNSYPSIEMFDYIAKKLIYLMGHSGTIPSAINAKDIPVALHKLRQALENVVEVKEDNNKSFDEEESISLNKRARPLIELLESAIENNDEVMWENT